MGITDKINETVEGVLVFWVAAIILAAITPNLFNVLANSEVFPYGATTTLIVQLLTLLLAIAVATNIFKKEEQKFVVQ